MNIRAKKIVAEAWQITNNNKQLLKFGFISSLFSILVGGAYFFYQITAFKHSKLFQTEQDYGFFIKIGSFAKDYSNLFLWLVITSVVIFVCYTFVPMICKGAITHLVMKIYKGEKIEHGVSTSLFRFLPLLETFAVKGTLKPHTFFTEWSFVVRNLGTGPAGILLPVLILGLVLGIIALFLFVFTTPFVIIQKANFSQSIRDSAKLAIRNFGTTFSLFLIFLLIELRVILNVAVILLIPVAILAITGLFATIVLKTLGLIIACILGAMLIFLTAFITGTLEVFSTAIWTIAFLKFLEEEEENVVK